MDSKLQIKRVAVLGAGVMGAQIASHFSNAGFDVLLYDLAAKVGSLNGTVEKSIKLLSKLKPSPLATKSIAANIKARNYQEHLTDLNNCDLIVEAVAERLDIKQSLYNNIAPHINEQAVLVSNTSGLSINTLSDLLPSNMQERFCGVHFFNPPRYMHLLELIPSKNTSADLLNNLEEFFVQYIGKGVVRAKDTPNFIANRIGVFSLLATIHHAERLEIPFEVVDALTGSLLGRPKSATFRTMDVVGLDTMMHVVNTMKDSLTDDPWHEFYSVPAWLNALIEKGALGQKTRAGIYKKDGRSIKVLNLKQQDYVEQQVNIDSEVQTIMAEKNLAKRFAALQGSSSKQAQFLWSCFRDVFHYCAYHLETIANNVRDVDLAIRWGFGWQQGPMETWQCGDLNSIKEILEVEINAGTTMSSAPLPAWLKNTSEFYNQDGAYNPSTNSYQARSKLPVYKRQLSFDKVLGEKINQGETILETEAVRLWTLDKKIAILSFKSKANCIGSDVLDGMNTAIDIAEKKYQGLVIWQASQMNFSVGANLKQFIKSFSADKSDELRAAVYQFQRVALRLKYCSIPTVAGLKGRALGGGCEMLMHCDDAVAALESYVGLVEIGVGLLPAGGGLKELALRAHKDAGSLPSYPLLENHFKTVAMAAVAGSGAEAKEKAFLKPNAQIVLNSDEVLFLAIEKAKYLVCNNYLPPIPAAIPVHGREANARLNMIIVNMAQGGFISEHDAMIAKKIANVISGGDLNEGELVDEEWFLRLEIDAFVELAQTEKTQARVGHLLETGKPLRN